MRCSALLQYKYNIAHAFTTEIEFLDSKVNGIFKNFTCFEYTLNIQMAHHLLTSHVIHQRSMGANSKMLKIYDHRS